MKEFIIDVLKVLFLMLVTFVIIALTVLLIAYDENRQSKKECYEIYATDNVILKKCEKYFDKEK